MLQRESTQRWFVVALVTGIWLTLFWPLLLGQREFVFRDTATLYYPLFQWIDQQLRILIRQENPDGSVLDVKILDDQEVNGRHVRKVDMFAISPDGSSVHGIQWYDEELNIVVRQQVDDGSIDELRNITVEDVNSNLFTIPEGYKSVETQLTDSNSNLP